MGFVYFYWECLKLAWGAAAWARSTNFIITVLLPVVTYAVPNTHWFQETMPNAYIWLQQMPAWITWAPLALFLSFFIIRLLLAPYWIYQETKRRLDHAIRAQDPVKKKNKIAEFREKGERLFSLCRKNKISPTEALTEFEKFDSEVIEFISNNLDQHFLVTYKSTYGLGDPSGLDRSLSKHIQRVHRGVSNRLVRLKEIQEQL